MQQIQSLGLQVLKIWPGQTQQKNKQAETPKWRHVPLINSWFQLCMFGLGHIPWVGGVKGWISHPLLWASWATVNRGSSLDPHTWGLAIAELL